MQFSGSFLQWRGQMLGLLQHKNEFRGGRGKRPTKVSEERRKNYMFEKFSC